MEKIEIQIRSMLIQFFPDSRPESRASLLRHFDDTVIDTALQREYIFQYGENYVGKSPLYYISDLGRDFRDKKI